MRPGKDKKRGPVTLQVTSLATHCSLLMAELSYNSLWETKFKKIYFFLLLVSFGEIFIFKFFTRQIPLAKSL